MNELYIYIYIFHTYIDQMLLVKIIYGKKKMTLYSNRF
jgi:hypothetical protein